MYEMMQIELYRIPCNKKETIDYIFYGDTLFRLWRMEK